MATSEITHMEKLVSCLCKGLGGRPQPANHSAVPDDLCIGGPRRALSRQGGAGAEARKRNIPGKECACANSAPALRLLQVPDMSSPLIEAPSASVPSVSARHHTRVSRRLAPSAVTADNRQSRSVKLATLDMHSRRLCMDALGCLFRLCARIPAIGRVCSTACQLQPDAAVCRVATGDRLKALLVGDIRVGAVVLPDGLNGLVVRSLCLHAAVPAVPQLLDSRMMALSSHKHALEMNCGPACTSAVLLVGGCVSARQPCARICALRYPLIDCDSYPSPRPLHRPCSSLHGKKKTFPWLLLGVTLIDSSPQSPGMPNHASRVFTETFSH